MGVLPTVGTIVSSEMMFKLMERRGQPRPHGDREYPVTDLSAGAISPEENSQVERRDRNYWLVRNFVSEGRKKKKKKKNRGAEEINVYELEIDYLTPRTNHSSRQPH